MDGFNDPSHKYAWNIQYTTGQKSDLGIVRVSHNQDNNSVTWIFKTGAHARSFKTTHGPPTMVRANWNKGKVPQRQHARFLDRVKYPESAVAYGTTSWQNGGKTHERRREPITRHRGVHDGKPTCIRRIACMAEVLPRRMIIVNASVCFSNEDVGHHFIKLPIAHYQFTEISGTPLKPVSVAWWVLHIFSARIFTYVVMAQLHFLVWWCGWAASGTLLATCILPHPI